MEHFGKLKIESILVRVVVAESQEALSSGYELIPPRGSKNAKACELSRHCNYRYVDWI